MPLAREGVQMVNYTYVSTVLKNLTFLGVQIEDRMSKVTTLHTTGNVAFVVTKYRSKEQSAWY